MVSSAVSLQEILGDAVALRRRVDDVSQNLLVRLEEQAAGVVIGAPRALMFASLAVACRRMGTGNVNRLMNRALNTAERIEDLEERVDAMCTVSAVLLGGSLGAEARESADRARAAATAIADADVRARAMLKVAAAYQWLGSPKVGADALRAVLPVAEPAVAPAAELIEEIAEIEPVEEITEVEEIQEIAEPAPPRSVTNRPARPSRPTGSAPAAPAKPAFQASKDEIDEGEFKDPTAGVKFPAYRPRRRR